VEGFVAQDSKAEKILLASWAWICEVWTILIYQNTQQLLYF